MRQGLIMRQQIGHEARDGSLLRMNQEATMNMQNMDYETKIIYEARNKHYRTQEAMRQV